MLHKIELNAGLYEQIIDACSFSVAKDDYRPRLRYIRIDVHKDNITAFSCNGYQLARIVIKNKFEDEFTCYIRPVKVKDKEFTIELNFDDETGDTQVCMPTFEGKIVYVFSKPYDENKLDPDKIIGDSEERPYSIGLSTNRMIEACKGLQKFGKGYFVLHIPTNKNKGVLLQSLTETDKKVVVEQFVLPVRYDL